MQKPYRTKLRGALSCLTAVFSSLLFLWLALTMLQSPDSVQAQAELTNKIVTQQRSLAQAYVTNDAELADVDADGDLDMLLVNEVPPYLLIYENNGGNYNEIMDWNPQNLGGVPTNAAWGDADGDGDLDLAVAIWASKNPNLVYRNEGGRLLDTPDFVVTNSDRRDAFAVAWGDLNGDGKLDLVFGHGRTDPEVEALATPAILSQTNIIYQNTTITTGENVTLTFTAVWTSTSALPTKDIALADVDGDNDLDIAVANGALTVPPVPFSNTLYINNVVTTTNPNEWEWEFQEVPITGMDSQIPVSTTTSVAWANLVDTQLPELIVGNTGSPSEVYCNRASVGETPRFERCWNSAALFDSPQAGNLQATHIAVADINFDGQLDIAISGFNRPNFVLCGEHTQNEPGFRICWDSTEFGLNLFSQRLNFGDVNGDGLLDLIEGNGGGATVEQTVNIYYNLQSVLMEQTASGSQADLGDISSGVLGDLDADGDLDLIVGRSQHTDGVTDTIYFNEGGVFIHNEPLILAGAENPVDSRTQSVALTQIEGQIFLAVGRGTRLVSQHHTPMATMVYTLTDFVENSSVTFTPVWTSTSAISVTTSVAWGDMNGDGFPDLAVGNVGETLDSNRIFTGEFNQVFVYDPEAKTFVAEAAWQSPEPRQTYELGWGDVDNDGDLDLAVANFNQPNELFLNEGGMLSEESVWVPNGRYYSTDLAWADINNDGLLDIIFSNGIQNSLQRSLLYLNKGGTFAADPDWTTEPLPAVHVVATDLDNDGDIDVAFQTNSVTGNETLNHLYINDGGVLNDTPLRWGNFVAGRSTSGIVKGDLLFGDVDNDGDSDLLDLFRGAFPIENRFIANARFTNELTLSSPSIHIMQTGIANFYDAATGIVTLPFELSNIPEGEQLSITAYYSLNGGGSWSQLVGQWQGETAVQPTNAPLQADVPYLYTFDPITNGLLGHSDNFVVRLVATPYQATNSRLLYENAAPAPILYGSPATVSPPFRVVGRQIQVVDVNGNPLSDAIVFKQEDINGLFRPFANFFAQSEETLDFRDPESVYQTDVEGNLQGRGSLSNGDRLFALWPVPLSDGPTVPQNVVSLLGTQTGEPIVDLYYVSHSPTATGVTSTAVEDAQSQMLTIDQSNSLYLFNLDVSLEWDASNEPGYLAQLQQDIERASAILYDLTDGQMALGEINIYMDKERWRESHIQIHASNRYRPNADFGGIVSRPMSLTLGTPPSGVPLTNTLVLPNVATDTIYGTGVITNAIWPGQVRMPALWNRFGEPGFEGGEDWARTLAHELGHYLLFLPDNYLLAREETGYLLEVDNNNPCAPSAMTTAYANTTELNSEFLATFDGYPCDNVIAMSLTGLSDWEVISAIYGIQPQSSTTGDGPRRLPLAVTQVKLNLPEEGALAPIDRFFFVGNEDGTTEALSSRTVSSYLIRSGEFITEVIPLGAPIGNQVWARGAKVGDELCVYDAPSSTENRQPRSACGTISVDGVSLRFEEIAWVPIVSVEPPEIGADVALERPFPTTLTITTEIGISPTNSVNSVTIQLFTNLISQTMAYPSPEIELTRIGDSNQFSTTIALGDIPVDGYVRVWINDQKDTQVMVPFFLGGGWLPDHWASGPDHWASGPDHWASGVGFRTGWNAPVSTGDGELTIFNICSAFNATPAYQLQALPTVPDLPVWLVPVGLAYHIALDDNHEFSNCPSGTNQEVATSLLFNYLERDLPNRVYEDQLQVYSLDGNEWKPLDNTTRNTTQNLVSGGYLTDTVYVLGMSTQIPLTRGWNLIGYPLRQRLPIEDIIEPIQENITLIYGYSNGALTVYCPEENNTGVRPGPGQSNGARLICSRQANNEALTHFEFGHGYWVLAANETILRLPVDLIGAEDGYGTENGETAELPAIIHGTVVFPKDSARSSGAKVVAWMNGQPCAEAELMEIDGQYAYQLAINRQDARAQQPCGALNQPVTFTLNGAKLPETAMWDNRVVQELPLTGPEPSQTAVTPIWVLVVTVAGLVGGLLIFRQISW